MKSGIYLLALYFGSGLSVDADASCSVEIEPSKDNTLYEDLNGSTSNGAGQHLFVGRTDRGRYRRGLVAFDIAAAIPGGASIESTCLTLHMSKSVGPFSSRIGLARLLSDWGEGASVAPGDEGRGAPTEPGDATWLHTFWSKAPWVTPGGDFESSFDAVVAVAGVGFYSWESTEELSQAIQQWLDHPETNFGWALIAETPSNRAKRFDTRESWDPLVRPHLLVTFAPPALSNAIGAELP